MRGVIRALVLVGSVSFGSWVGLHPSSSSSKVTSSAPSPASSSSAAPPSAPPPSNANATQPKQDTTTDQENAPEIAPWPHLNPEANIGKAWRLAEGPHREPNDKRRLVTLTFDDGPFPETTPKVLSLLAQYNVHATFFVIGRYLDGDGERARASRDVLKKVVEAGHLVGNHTHDHALLTAISHTQVLEQIDRGAASIERAIGKKPILFRPPFGELDDFGQDAVRARGLDVQLWNIEAQDMERDDTARMFRELVHQIAYNEGGVVLLHDIRWTSVNILKRLLAYLESKRYDPAHPEKDGYEIVDLPTYLRAVEASPPQRDARSAPRKAADASPPPTPKTATKKSGKGTKTRKKHGPEQTTTSTTHEDALPPHLHTGET